LTLCHKLSIVQPCHISQSVEKEKERRRGEILDAAEALYRKDGWDLVTVDQIARGALVTSLGVCLLQGQGRYPIRIGERAMSLLRDRFIAASAGSALGVEKIEAIGRSYMAYSFEFTHYFDFCCEVSRPRGQP